MNYAGDELFIGGVGVLFWAVLMAVQDKEN